MNRFKLPAKGLEQDDSSSKQGCDFKMSLILANAMHTDNQSMSYLKCCNKNTNRMITYKQTDTSINAL